MKSNLKESSSITRSERSKKKLAVPTKRIDVQTLNNSVASWRDNQEGPTLQLMSPAGSTS